jgi:pimeloyl-ACP methyl ester carboxylesterase
LPACVSNPTLPAKAAAIKAKAIALRTGRRRRFSSGAEKEIAMTDTTTTQTTYAVNGIDMYVDVRGDGEPLLLLHGFTGSGADWRHVFDLDDLARRFRLIIPDLRGHGRSTNPAGSFTHRQCARDVAALLDQLGVARYRAIGASLGGNTLLHLATAEPQRPSAMVLVSATMYYPAPARAIMREVTVESRSPEEWQVMRASHHHGDDQIRALWRHARGFADSHDDLCFTPPQLATIQARTLIVYGDRDPLYPVDMAVEMFHAIPGAALWVMPQAGHAPIFAGDARVGFARTALAFVTTNADADAGAATRAAG